MSTELPVFAFTDESGNTGENLFDPQQPYFWTGTSLSPNNLDITAVKDVEAILARAKITELHGAELGLARLETIASEIETILDKNKCIFVFTKVEKEHVASMKLVDTILDSGINKAVSVLHYGSRYLRLPLSHVIAYHMTDDLRRDFWDVYKNGDQHKFCEILRTLKTRIVSKTDKRALELLNRAIDYAIAHPDEFVESQRGPLDAPNIVAFGLLVNGIHHIFDNTPVHIEEFVHDEQNQFAKSLRTTFDSLKRLSFSPSIFALISDFKEVDTYKRALTMKSSDKSAGLQLIDIVLWLIKQHQTKGLSGFPQCEELAIYVLPASHLFEFSYDQLAEDVLMIHIDSETAVLSEDEIQRGKKFLNDIEKRIQNNLKSGSNT